MDVELGDAGRVGASVGTSGGARWRARRRRDLLVGLPALSTGPAAWAADPSAVLATSLGLSGLVAGAVSGLLAALAHSRVRFLPAFLVYLGLLGMVATTRAQSMEALPLALVLGAALGIIPFAAAYFVVRAIALGVRGSGKNHRGRD